jgi:hypothetical protein
MTGPREVPELVIRERQPSTLRNFDGGPPGGAGAGDPGAPTTNAKKRRRELEIQERPSSTLRNVYDGPPGGAGAGDLRAQRLRSPPLGQGR